MLVQTEIHNVPRPHMNNSLDHKMININDYLSSFKPISPIDAITFESTIQVVVALLYNNNPEQPVNITLPIGTTSIEILNTPFVQILSSLFKIYRFIVNENNIIGLFVKGLLDDTREAFQTLKKNKKIDPCLDRLLRSYHEEECRPINAVAFEVKNSDLLSKSETVSLALSNKFFMYLLTQSIRNNGFFSIPFHAWNKEEIEDEHYFNELKRFFNKVFIVGAGKKWRSTHLIVNEPFQDIVHCIVNKNF